MTDRVFSGLLTRVDLAPRPRAERFLEMLEQEAPHLVPRRYGSYEPIKVEYTSRVEAARGWEEGFIWRGQARTVEGTVYTRERYVTHSDAAISGRMGAIGVTSLVRFLKAATVEFDADFGYTHLINDKEIRTSAPETIGGIGDRDRVLIVVSRDLEKYIPDLYWATIFGRVYTEKFGHDKLRKAPAPFVCELDNGSFYLQLSDDIGDMHSNFEQIEAVRAAVKSHLGSEWFYDPAKPRAHRYLTPPELAEGN
jgi:hypothetical protein